MRGTFPRTCHQSLKSSRGIAKAEGHPLPLEQTQFTCKSSLLSVHFAQRNLPEGRTQIQCSKKNWHRPVSRGFRLCVVLGKRPLSPRSGSKNYNRIGAFPIFSAMTTPQAQGNFEDSIVSYSSNISVSARHASDLCGVMRLASSLCGAAPSSN